MTATGSIGREGVDVVSVMRYLHDLANTTREFSAADQCEAHEARTAVSELIEAADCPHANIIFRENGPGYVTVPADDWNRLRAALARCEPKP